MVSRILRCLVALGLFCPLLALAITPMVAAGSGHTVALKSDGTVMSWGHNDYGQLGFFSVTQRTSPVPVNGLTGVVSVDAGYHHTVALNSDGSAMSWGYNIHGQLGDDSTTNRASPVAVAGSLNLGSIARPVVFSPTSLTFSGRAFGTSSAPQTLTLTNTSANPVSIAGITVSSNFSKTTTCTSSLAAGASTLTRK